RDPRGSVAAREPGVSKPYRYLGGAVPRAGRNGPRVGTARGDRRGRGDRARAVPLGCRRGIGVGASRPQDGIDPDSPAADGRGRRRRAGRRRRRIAPTWRRSVRGPARFDARFGTDRGPIPFLTPEGETPWRRPPC